MATKREELLRKATLEAAQATVMMDNQVMAPQAAAALEPLLAVGLEALVKISVLHSGLLMANQVGLQEAGQDVATLLHQADKAVAVIGRHREMV
jgi:hypothetical protein|tara:strand:+ start:586 stop:867 length:282 start_codon:yes stop_codon:yes gene_type:complete